MKWKWWCKYLQSVCKNAFLWRFVAMLNESLMLKKIRVGKRGVRLNECLVVQSCLTLCNPWTVTSQASLSMGIFQARILEWMAMPSFRGSSQPRDGTWVSHIAIGLLYCRQILYHLSYQQSPRILDWVACPFCRGSSWPRNWTGLACIAGRFFTNWATREASETE